MTVTGVSENVAANLIALMLIGFFAYLIIYVRMSGISKLYRRFIHPEKRVFPLTTVSIDDIVKSTQSEFLSPINEHEREILINFYTTRNQVHLFNGVAVRLDGLTMGTKKENSCDSKSIHR